MLLYLQLKFESEGHFLYQIIHGNTTRPPLFSLINFHIANCLYIYIASRTAVALNPSYACTFIIQPGKDFTRSSGWEPIQSTTNLNVIQSSQHSFVQALSVSHLQSYDIHLNNSQGLRFLQPQDQNNNGTSIVTCEIPY